MLGAVTFQGDTSNSGEQGTNKAYRGYHFVFPPELRKIGALCAHKIPACVLTFVSSLNRLCKHGYFGIFNGEETVVWKEGRTFF